MAPVAVAATIAMLFIILGVSEYMRLVITAAGIKDAMESAVVSVVNDNYNEVYHGVREGYAAGYEPDDTGFAASVDHGDIYGRMCFLLGLEEDGNSYVRYNNSGELEYRLKNLSVDIHNTALASREELIMRMQRSRWKCCAFRRKNLVEYVGQVEGEGGLPGEILVTCYRYRKTYYISIDFPDVLW